MYQVQEICGTVDDSLVCPKRVRYYSKVVKDRASTSEYQSFWLGNFTTRYEDLGNFSSTSFKIELVVLVEVIFVVNYFFKC